MGRENSDATTQDFAPGPGHLVPEGGSRDRPRRRALPDNGGAETDRGDLENDGGVLLLGLSPLVETPPLSDD